MKILILGGTGVIGAPMAKKLVEMGNDVFVTSRKKYENLSKISFLQGNAHDIGFLNGILKQNWDCIIDCMVYSTEEFKLRVNSLGSACDQYVFLSSGRVYAQSDKPLREDSPRLLDVCEDSVFLTTDEYSLAKARQENMLYESPYKNWTIVRPYMTYGTDRLQLGGFEMNHWLYRMINGRTIIFPKDIAEKWTALSFGDDVARGIALLVGNKKARRETINVVTPQSMKWEQILELYTKKVKEKMQITPKIMSVEHSDELAGIMHNFFQIKYDRAYNRIFDCTKLEQLVGKIGFRPMEEGLDKCLEDILEDNKKILDPYWKLEAYLDINTKERTRLREIKSVKDKMKYFVWRYTPYLKWKNR